MRSLARHLAGLVLEAGELHVRATVTGTLGEEARAQLARGLRERAGAAVSIDLSSVTDMRSEDVDFLVREAREAEQNGSRVRILAPSAAVYERLARTGTPLHVDLAAEPGPEGPLQEWGRFRVDRVLASPRGSVAFALDPRTGRRVVIKTSLPEERRAFVAAARAFEKKGPHENLVRVLEVDEALGLAVLEPVPGPSLAEVLERGGPLDLSQAISVARGIARALERLASAPGPMLVHGDVKPANVLLARDGSPLLADFELAREAGSPGAPSATAGYAAPERLRGEAAATSEDVFSFGVLVRELLPEDADAGAGSSLRGLIARCTNEDPTVRPPFAEVVSKLDAIASDLRGSADSLACAACGRFRYRKKAAPFACLLCGGPTRAWNARGPGDTPREKLGSTGSPAERIDAALRAGDAKAFEEARQAAAVRARSEPREALAAASTLLRLGRAHEARELASLVDAGTSRLGADRSLLLAEACLEIGDPRAARAELDSARDEVATSEARSLQAALLSARAFEVTDDLAAALGELARARRAAESGAHAQASVATSTIEGRAHLRRGEVEPAIAALERATRTAREGEPAAALAVAEARRLLAIALSRTGEHRRAGELAREAHSAFAEWGSPLGAARASRTLACALLEEGRAARAAEPLGFARALATRLGASLELAKTRRLEVELALERGQTDAARAAALAAQEALSRSPARNGKEEARVALALASVDLRGPGTVERLLAASEKLALAKAWDMPRGLVLLAEALELSSDPRAETTAASAEGAALGARLPVEAARSAAVLGRLALARGEGEQAARHLERALDLGGARPRLALVRARLDLARAYEAASRRAEADEARAQARALALLAGREDLVT